MNMPRLLAAPRRVAAGALEDSALPAAHPVIPCPHESGNARAVVGEAAMKWRRLHEWEVAAEEAERIQLRLAALARRERGAPDPGGIRLVAGAAVSKTAAAVVVLEIRTWRAVEARRVALPTAAARMRYRPGLMAFALGPPILAAFEQVESELDAAVFLAHGSAHPRRCGMATHLGLLLETPSLGCADRPLCGASTPPGPQRGDWTPVIEDGETVGACVRTREGGKPLYVSPGYRMDLESAVDFALYATVEQRWPEPLRQARMLTRNSGSGRVRPRPTAG